MRSSRKTIAAIGSAVVLATAAIITVLAVSGSHTPAARPPHSVVAAAAVAACSKLKTAAFPPAIYDELVIRQVNRAAGGGNATAAEIRTAKATVAAEVKAACPQFAYLAHA